MKDINMGKMKNILMSLLLLMSGVTLIAQDTVVQEAPAQKPLTKAAFESGYFIADQTVAMPPAKTLEFVIQHDFGTIQNHWKDLYGIWGASNIRLGLSFTVTKDLQVGFGTTKNKLYQDFSAKYQIMRQRTGGFPVTITVYGNMAIDCRNKSYLGNNKLSESLDYNSLVSDAGFRTAITDQIAANKKMDPTINYLTYNQATGLTGANETDLAKLFDQTFKASYRFSYYLEAMFARRFCKEFSAQVGIGWSHYNLVDFNEMANNHVGVKEMTYVPSKVNGGDSTTYSYKNTGKLNNNITLSFLGRIKFSPQGSVLLNYSQSVMTYTNMAPWPNFGVGVEISTSTHAFQIFLSAANGMLPQQNAMYNYNNPYKGAILLGFNITRLWTF